MGNKKNKIQAHSLTNPKQNKFKKAAVHFIGGNASRVQGEEDGTGNAGAPMHLFRNIASLPVKAIFPRT